MLRVSLQLDGPWPTTLPSCPLSDALWPRGVARLLVSTEGPPRALTIAEQPLVPLLTRLLRALADPSQDAPTTIALPKGGALMCERDDRGWRLTLGDDALPALPLSLIQGALYEAGRALEDHLALRLAGAHPEQTRALEAALATYDASERALTFVSRGAALSVEIRGQGPFPLPEDEAALEHALEALTMASETVLKTRSWPDGQWAFNLDLEGHVRLIIRGQGRRFFASLVDRARLPLSVEVQITPADLAGGVLRGLALMEGEEAAQRALLAQQLGRWARLLERLPLTAAEPPALTGGLEVAGRVPDEPALPVSQLHHLAYRRRWRHDHVQASPGAVRVLGDQVQFGVDGEVLTVDRRTGAQIWRRPSAHLLPCEGPADLLLDDTGDLIRVDTSTGDVAWRAGIGAGGLVAVASGAHGLLTAGVDGALWCLDPHTGEPRWSRQTLHGAHMGLAAAGGWCWSVGEDGLLCGIRGEDGVACWVIDLASEAEVSPRLTPHGLLAISHIGPAMEGLLTLICPRTGTIRWRCPLDGVVQAPPQLHGSSVIFTIGQLTGPALVSVDLTRGEIRWSVELPPGAEDAAGALTLVGDLAFPKGLEGQVTAVQLEDGRVRWRLPPEPDADALVANAPAVLCRGVLLVPGITIRALDPQGGRIIHSLPCEDLVPSWMHVWPDGDLLIAEQEALAYYLLGGHLALVQ